MKLIYVINHIDWFWSHRLPLAVAAKKAGYDVHVAVPGAAADERLIAHGFTPHDLPQGGMLKTLIALRTLFKKEQPNLVHAITLKTSFIAGLAGTNLRAIDFVFTIAGLGYLFSSVGLKPKILRMIISPFLKLALHGGRIIFQNPDDMEMLMRAGFAAQDRSYLIRGSGVDCTEFSDIAEPDNDTPLILMPTRLVHDKGVAVFIEAAKILDKKGIHARYEIAGGVTDNNPLAISKGEMEAMIADSPVKWLGKVSDMPALLAASNLIVYPSYYREGIPKVLLEAAATGRAIITTDHPGCREAVSDGDNGLLVPVRDAQATAQAMETLLHDPKRRAAMGERSRERAEKEFAVDLIVEQTIQTYTQQET